MNAMQQAAQERLDAVLAAPARGRTRHDQVADLCRQHANDQHVVTKEVAVAETTATGSDITGEFKAIVSDFGPDRQHERFTIGSFDKALDKIRRTGKATPVLFGHTQNAIGAVLGMVPPDGWRIDDEGLHAHGWLDVTEPLGMRMYKMLQSGALQWSIGFTTTRRAPRGRDGIVPLEEVGELLEVSVVPVPANELTRTLSAKSDRQAMSVEQLRQLEAEVGLAGALNRLDEQRHRIPS
jgi:HK97 family phage prohead protease